MGFFSDSSSPYHDLKKSGYKKPNVWTTSKNSRYKAEEKKAKEDARKQRRKEKRADKQGKRNGWWS